MIKRIDEDYTLYALGSRGSRPVHGRQFDIFGGQTTCFVVKYKTHAIIIDCGTGLFDAEELLKDCDVIDIVFSHVHYDHILGLLDFSIFPKDARINFIGSFREWLSYDTIADFYKHPFWPVQPNLGAICEISSDGNPYNLADGMVLQSFKGSHPDAANVIVLTLGGVKVCFMTDFEVNGDIRCDFIKGCKYLVFDGMFSDEEYSNYIGWGHSTYQEGCRLSSVYRVNELMITHHNPKNNDEKLLSMEEKAKLLFPHTRFLRAGDVFVIN